MATILVIEDESILARNICDSLKFGDHEASTVRTGEEGLAAADALSPDIILVDYRLPGIDGLEVLRELQRSGNTASPIMMTAHGHIDTAVEAMKTGAVDFLTKPIDLKVLQIVVDRANEHRRISGQLHYFRGKERADSTYDQIIGDSAPMRQVKSLIDRLVSTPALSTSEPPGILITGETGTGKDLIARAIHYAGPRSDNQFVQVNCTALPDHLVEAELFGHLKGAFTDARSDKRGLIDFAEGGTVFLDEIGHMPVMMQAKLLQTLEHRTIRPVGGTKERKINVHFIAATNRDLEAAINAGDFRSDLLHRLRTLTIHLCPLRERGDDVDALAHHFLRTHAEKFGIPVTRFTEDAFAAIRSYDWPGNVRELAHTIESAVLMADGPAIRPDHLNIKQATPASGNINIQIGASKSLAINFAENCPTLEEIEYDIIQAALIYSKHNLSRVARILGISRDAVRYRIERFEKKSND